MFDVFYWELHVDKKAYFMKKIPNDLNEIACFLSSFDALILSVNITSENVQATFDLIFP